jgi:hypothetical protein
MDRFGGGHRIEALNPETRNPEALNPEDLKPEALKPESPGSYTLKLESCTSRRC